MGPREMPLLVCIAGASGCSLIVDALGPYESGPTDAGVVLADAQGSDAPRGDAGAPDAPAEGPSCVPGSPALLTDRRNCGACGHVCCGALCSNGECAPTVPLALESSANDPVAIALDPDGTAAYWSHVDADGGVAIVRFDETNETVATIASGLYDVHELRVGSDAVFFTENGTDANGNGVARVASIPKHGGGSPSVLGTTLGQANGIALTGTRVWWTDDGWGPPYQNGSIQVADLDGGHSQTVYGSLSGPWAIAVQGATIVWTDFDYGHDVELGSADGASPLPIYDAGTNSDPAFVVSDDAGTFWGDFTQSSLVWLGSSGVPQSIAQAPAGSSIGGIALDRSGNYVFWVATGPNGGIWATARAGLADAGSPTSMLIAGAGGLSCPIQVAADDRCVYWTSQGTCTSPWGPWQPGTGSVMRIDKPQ